MIKIISSSANIEIKNLNQKNIDISEFYLKFKIDQFNGEMIFFDHLNDINFFLDSLHNILKGKIFKTDYINFEENISIYIEKYSNSLICYGCFKSLNNMSNFIKFKFNISYDDIILD